MIYIFLAMTDNICTKHSIFLSIYKNSSTNLKFKHLYQIYYTQAKMSSQNICTIFSMANIYTVYTIYTWGSLLNNESWSGLHIGRAHI